MDTVFLFISLWCLIHLGEGEQGSFFQLMIPSMRMTNEIVKTFPKVSLLKCAIICARNEKQVAFNYNVRNGTCEILVKRVKLNTDLGQFYIKDPDYNNYALNLCRSSPCLHDSVCELTSDGTAGFDYQCSKCHKPYAAKNCDVKIGSFTVTINTRNYTVYPTKTVRQDDSSNYCTSKGMGMVIIKDNVTAITELLRDALYDEDSGFTKRVAFWLGMYRVKATDTSWTWVDKTLLTGTPPWGSKNFSTNLCACVKYDTNGVFGWYADPCIPQSGWEYYSFCMK